MTLATRCPQCQTTFKVVADQLKLRRGLVRCGVCRQVFSGEEHLTDGPPARVAPPIEPFETLEPIAAAPVARASTTPESSIPESPLVESSEPDRDQPRPAWRIPVEETGSLASGVDATPVRNPADPAEPAETPAETPAWSASPVAAAGRAGTDEDWGLARAAALDRTDETEPRLFAPAQEDKKADEQDAVDFFATNRKARGFDSRGAVVAALASFVLTIVLAAQLTIGARDWIAARFAPANTLLNAALTPLGLQVLPPRELRALTIESFELQSTGVDGLLALNALLRNAAGHRVRWPAMELSLNDATGKVVVRRVLMPGEYLAPETSERNGIAPRAEQSVRTGLRAQDLAVTAYSVKLFYP